MITIATNMAGRGTDIVLGGNVEKQCELIDAIENLPPEEKKLRADKLRGEWQALHNQVGKAGGLHIIGTERHESRRIDNQLRGRSGRQGDPGSSRFYMALEDPLLRIFAGDRINRIMVMLKMPEGEAIEHAMVTRSIESAQRKVEARNFDIRKQLLEYDDVANDQRKEIYAQRNEIIDAHWREHLAALDHLRQGIHLRGYAQKNPKQEYKREAFELFGAMVEAVKLEVTKTLTAVQIRTQDDIKPDDQSHIENVRPLH